MATKTFTQFRVDNIVTTLPTTLAYGQEVYYKDANGNLTLWVGHEDGSAWPACGYMDLIISFTLTPSSPTATINVEEYYNNTGLVFDSISENTVFGTVYDTLTWVNEARYTTLKATADITVIPTSLGTLQYPPPSTTSRIIFGSGSNGQATVVYARFFDSSGVQKTIASPPDSTIVGSFILRFTKKTS